MSADRCPYPTNIDLSRQVADAVWAEVKACWRNAILGQIFLTERKETTAFYVEGWVVDQSLGLAFEHGWIEVDGQIVDPTLILSGRELNVVYFPGICYTLDDVQGELDRQSATWTDDDGRWFLPFALWNSWQGKNKSYQAARAAACTLAYGLELKE